MRLKEPEVFGIYTKNPEKVSLLILKSSKDSSKILGRALVWNIDEITTPSFSQDDTKNAGDFVFMDRIYCHLDSDVELFRSYATENGMYYKENNDSNEICSLVSKDGTLSDVTLLVNLKKNCSTSDKFPYMDTLKYLDTSDGELTNDEDRSHHITLEATNGRYTEDETCDYCGGDEYVECGECGGSGREECYECSGSGQVECEVCDGSGEVDGEECGECLGNGENTCGECDGDGENSCSECGDALVPCPECY
jgi:hypothetical protein